MIQSHMLFRELMIFGDIRKYSNELPILSRCSLKSVPPTDVFAELRNPPHCGSDAAPYLEVARFFA